jgi:hypothetical protein
MKAILRSKREDETCRVTDTFIILDILDSPTNETYYQLHLRSIGTYRKYHFGVSYHTFYYCYVFIYRSFNKREK